MKKVANMNDGHTTVEYDSIEELNNSVSAPYNSLCPIQEYEGTLIGKEGIAIGTYKKLEKESILKESSSVTNMDKLF